MLKHLVLPMKSLIVLLVLAGSVAAQHTITNEDHLPTTDDNTCITFDLNHGDITKCDIIRINGVVLKKTDGDFTWTTNGTKLEINLKNNNEVDTDDEVEADVTCTGNAPTVQDVTYGTCPEEPE